MNPVKLKPGLSFKLFDEVYSILKLLPNDNVEAAESRFNTVKIFKQSELITYLCNGNLFFECRGKNLKSEENSTIKTSHVTECLESEVYKDRAIFKYEVILPLLDIPYSKRHAAILSRVAEVNSWFSNPKTAKEKLNGCNYYQNVSSASVYRWIGDYLESNCDIISLLPSYHNSGGKYKSRLAPPIIEFIHEGIDEEYKRGQQISKRSLHDIIIVKIAEHNKFSVTKLPFPSYSTLARFVSQIPEFDLVSTRIGGRTAENKFGMVGNGVRAYYPLERVEIDHTPIDLIILDENGKVLGRPHLILAIDKCTRQVLGFSIGIGNNVGWSEVMQCMANILTDKSYVKEAYPFVDNEWTAFGVPKTIVIDNGLEFKNNAMKDAAYQLGFVLQYCPPKVPKWKGSIERFLGTINTSLFHNIPGTTRSNPQQLGDDENPSELARVRFSTFIALVHKWIIDVYSQDYNKGAGGIPALLWSKLIQEYPVSWPNNISEVSILLGKTAYRKISNRGIEYNRQFYNNSELNMILKSFTTENNGKNIDFQIKYNPMNIGEIFVYDKLINKKWIKVKCVNYEYACNLSEWEHKEILSYAKKEYGTVDIVSLAQSKQVIRQMIKNDDDAFTKGEKARAKRINSGNEVEKKLKENSMKKAGTVNEQNYVVNNDVSDFGYNLDSSDDVIIPEICSYDKTKTGKEKVINIENAKKGNKRKKTAVEDTSTDNDFFDSLEGFSYVSNVLGDERNE